MPRSLRPLRLPLPELDEYVFPMRIDGPETNGFGVFLKLLLSLYVGPGIVFGLMTLYVVITQDGDSLERVIREYWPWLVAAAVVLAAFIARRSVGRHLKVRRIASRVRGKELIADASGFRICSLLVSRGALGSAPGGVGAISAVPSEPYLSLYWDAIRQWDVAYQHVDDRRVEFHRIGLEDGSLFFIDRGAFGPDERLFLELARRHLAVPITIQDPNFKEL